MPYHVKEVAKAFISKNVMIKKTKGNHPYVAYYTLRGEDGHIISTLKASFPNVHSAGGGKNPLINPKEFTHMASGLCMDKTFLEGFIDCNRKEHHYREILLRLFTEE